MKIKQFAKLWSAVSLVVLYSSTIFTPLAYAIPAGAGLQSSSTTSSSLAAVNGATSLSAIQTAMQSFVGQYGLTFSTTCGTLVNTTCSTLTEADLGDTKKMSQEFIEEWSKYPTQLISYTNLLKINFVKTLVITGGLNQARAAEPDPTDRTMLYDVSYSSSEAYMRNVIHHEFNHYIEFTRFGSFYAPDAVYSSYNPVGFTYGTGGASCYSGSCPSGEHVVPGFATGYATSSIEEDKAELYGHLFWTEGYNNMQNWIITDTALAQKVANYKAFLLSIVPSINASYFTAIHDYYTASHTTPTVPNPTRVPTTTTVSDDQSTISRSIASTDTLIVDGKVGQTTVNSGGVLKGTGTVGALTVLKDGIVAPGHSPGCLNSGNLTLLGTYQAEIGGTNPCTGYDQLKVTGTVDLSGSTLNASLYQGFVPQVGQSYTVIDNDMTDAVTGTFTGITEGGAYSNQGVTYTVTYKGGDGNDVVLTVSAVDATAVPKKPDTGFALVSMHPIVALATSTLAATVILVVARKLRPSVK